MISNALIPFVFEKLPVRGAVVQLSDEWRKILALNEYPAAVRDVLGHAAAATPLIAQSMKSGSSVTLQLTGGSALSMLIMQCTSELDFRGLANADGDVTGKSFADLSAGGRCAITVDNVNTERPYQGIVEVGGDTLAANLETYFMRSAQLPSYLSLVADDRLAGGILLQQLPGEREPHGDDWRRLGFLSETLRLQDLEGGVGPELLRKFFSEDDLRVFDPRPARFKCRCSRERAANVLRLLGPEECELTAKDEEQLVVTCEYCGRRETFDPVDIAAIFSEGQAPESSAIH